MTRITKISVMVECDGQPCAIHIGQEHAELAAQMMSVFCRDGVLQLVRLPAGCQFTDLSRLFPKDPA